MDWVTSATLRQLRERRALDPESVEQEARRLPEGLYARITAIQLRGWESGVGVPDLEHLETLAEIYVCPVGHFFLDQAPRSELPFSFRGLSPGKEDRLSHATRRALARVLELADWMATLIDEAGITWPVKVEPRADALKDVDAAVRAGRQRLSSGRTAAERAWRTADDAFAWWRGRIESLGIFCFQRKLETQDIRGASLWLPSGREPCPVIVVNRENAEAATGRLFTLLHEYAHILTGGRAGGLACDFHGSGRGRNEEPLANRFAAQMLLPRETLRGKLKEAGLTEPKDDWPDTKLDALRKPLFVSRDVVAIRLEEMGLAPKGFYARKRADWDRQYAGRVGGGRGGKNPTKHERLFKQLGTSGLRVLSEANLRGRLPVLDAAIMLDMKVEKVPAFLEWSQRLPAVVP
ncbi:MAG: ImmA/IrrE family metallo-endopeptidase [Phycisphaerales bacterium]|nr:MAG: ImmA/IrrE family metallo-endopeptidase [Phycisphaerales bacterium]